MTEDLVRRYVDAVNARDVDTLVGMMTDDHWYVDTGRNAVRGVDAAKGAWGNFFGEITEYNVSVSSVETTPDGFVVLGSVASSEPKLTGDMIFECWVRDDKIALWRANREDPKLRERLGLVEAEPAAEAAN